MPKRCWPWFMFIPVALAACSRTDVSAPSAPSGTVRFVLVAPLCSSVLPVQFSIDGVQVGTDTFRVAVSGVHTASRSFATSAGEHSLGAQVTGGYVWPPTAVTVGAGQTVSDSLSYYCS